MTVNIKTLREQNNLSVSQLATLSGVSEKTIKRYEKNPEKIKNANSLTVYKIAKTLNCKFEDLF